MDSLKNLIARRRPSTGHDATAAPPVRAAAQDQNQTGTAPEATSDGFEDIDLKAAKAARDRVPEPKRQLADHYPDWNRPRTRLAKPTEPPAMSAEPEPETPAQKIWNLEKQTPPYPDVAHAPAQPDVPSIAPARPQVPVPPVATTRTASERVKTRLIGFHNDSPVQDVFDGQEQVPAQANPAFPIGWLVVVEGPGRGASFTLTAGLSTLGRDADQTVSLDFGDTAISRNGHVSIAYDEQQNAAYVGHGGKQNIVRINDKPLLSTEELKDGDKLKIGKTELQFVAFCGDGFSWAGQETQDG